MSTMGTRTSMSISSASTPSEFAVPVAKRAFPKSDIQVNIEGHYSSKVYTSSSPLTGNVTITTRRDVRFDSIQILLLGQSKTAFEGLSVPQEVTHTFLKMAMPIPESSYPVPRVLETGRTYTIPFNFVIPNQLTINACSHTRLSDQVQDHHVLLPPSLGGWQRDDLAPRMARVEYTIKARVLREDEVGSKQVRIMEATQAIQVLPATPEQPPLNVTDKDRLYRMAKSKTLRKNLLATRLGRLTAEAAQPSAAVLSADGRRVMSHPIARVRLTFEPESARTLPPTITAVSAKLTAHTFYSSGTISSFPNLGEWNEPYILDRRGQFFTSMPLPTVTLAEQPAWTPLSAPSASAEAAAAAAAATAQPPLTRRDSGYCSSDVDDDDNNNAGRAPTKKTPKPAAAPAASSPSSRTSHHHQQQPQTQTPTAHTTTLMIPLALPTDKKTLVPTFHSCIASRVYTAQLTVHTVTRGASNTISLVVPLQVAIEEPAAVAVYSTSKTTTTSTTTVPIPGPPSTAAAAAATTTTTAAATATAATESLASSLAASSLHDRDGNQARGQQGEQAAAAAAAAATTVQEDNGDDDDSSSNRPPSFEEAAADEHLRPRVLHQPDDEFIRRAREGRASWAAALRQQQQQQQQQGRAAAAAAAERGLPPGYGEHGFRTTVG